MHVGHEFYWGIVYNKKKNFKTIKVNVKIKSFFSRLAKI